MEANSDLEAALLGDKAREPELQNLRSQHKGEEQEPWKFSYYSYLRDDVFAEAEHHSRGRREYNKKQRETLEGFKEVDSLNNATGDGQEAGGEPKKRGVELAMNLSNIMNVVLLGLKIYASVQSRSLAIIASTLDSLLDLVAGMVLWFAHFTMQKKNLYKYPIGKLRVQPVGIVVFAATMTTLGVQVLITGVEQLMEGDSGSPWTSAERNWLMGIMGIAIVVKLGLYIYCRTFEDEIVLAYSMDHFFDIVTNGVGLVAALVAQAFYWWIDPVGAIFLALYTIINWGKTVLENAISLVGQSAPPHLLQKLTYMAFNHHQAVQKIDTVRAYAFGTFYFVEVDIQLPEEMSLYEAHEIGESLQNKLESLPEVERAFVHLDYETTHAPEHLIVSIPMSSSFRSFSVLPTPLGRLRGFGGGSVSRL
ncbi:hypothetical protein R1sor_021774 [Riccia sorocarpa]|uniref:Cation efflux protein cytoplasmic domain-containing protein n=1 Tax=Riccia sorocarpa TaxID=122646 RepID=A0ABD3GIQ6_9MARC